MIYTIGHEKNYLAAIDESVDGKIQKLGPQDARSQWGFYPGGCAFRTYEEAAAQAAQRPGYAVFGLDAEWEADTYLSPHAGGPWRSLARDADIIVLDENGDPKS